MFGVFRVHGLPESIFSRIYIKAILVCISDSDLDGRGRGRIKSFFYNCELGPRIVNGRRAAAG